MINLWQSSNPIDKTPIAGQDASRPYITDEPEIWLSNLIPMQKCASVASIQDLP